MTHSRLLLACALALALGAPIASQAQSQPQPGTVPAASTAPHEHHEHGMMRAVKELNLSDAQRSQIQQLVQQYRQQHPKGSTPDPQARKDLRDKIFAALTPDQQTQLKQRLAQMRADRQKQDGAANGNASAPPAPASSPNAL